MPSRSSRLGRPPGSTSDATRKRILTAACECFGEKGYEATTNRDIGDRAGVTGAAIYQYFDSKLSLFVECFRAAHADVVPHLRAAIAGTDGARQALKAVTVAYAETWRRFPAASVFLSSIPGEVRRHPEIAPVLAAEPDTVLTITSEIAERGVRSGEIDPAVASVISSTFFSIILGLAQQGSMYGEQRVHDAAEGYAKLVDGQVFRDSEKP